MLIWKYFCNNKMENLKSIKVAEFSLKTMSYFGDWRPTSLTSDWAIRLYNLYSIFMILFKFYFSITFFINLYQNKHKIEIFIEGIFLFTTTFLTVIKIVYLNIHRKDVNSLRNMFLETNCLPRNNKEILIYKNIQYKERLVMFTKNRIINFTITEGTGAIRRKG